MATGATWCWARARPSSSTGPAMPLVSALADSRYLMLQACARHLKPEVLLQRPLERVGHRQGGDLDAFVAQGLGVLGRSTATNAAAPRLRRSGCGALPRRKRSPTSSVLAITWANGTHPLRLQRDLSIRSRIGHGCRVRDTWMRGALGSRSIAVLAQSGHDSVPLASCREKSSSEPNQPSKPCPSAQRRFKTFIAALSARRPCGAARHSSGQRPARQFCKPQQADEASWRRFSSPRWAAASSSAASAEKTSRNSPASRRPLAADQGRVANQISMPSFE